MGKRSGEPMLKACITESLMLLLEEKPLDQVSVKEIVEKAGVNRSTYYRHFQSKQEVVRYFYRMRLDECLSGLPGDITLERYFAAIFTGFLRCKRELILLDRQSLSYLLLDELNLRAAAVCGSGADPVQRLYRCYHVGGVFNSFRFWLAEGMTTPPEMLAKQCVEILPADFSPRLWKQH